MNVSKTIIPAITAISLVATTVGGCHLPGRAFRAKERAERYFKAGEYDNAKIEYLNLLRLDHENALAFQQLGLIWFEQGAPLRAIPFLLRERELAPNNVAPRAKLALAFMAIGQTGEARKEATSVLQLDPANPDAILLLADTSRSKEEIAATEQQLQTFPQKDSAVFHLASARLAMRRDSMADASAQIQQALALEPKSALAHSAMAYLYLLQKDSNRAGQEFKTAAELAPVRSNERIKYAEVQSAAGQIDQAKVSLQDITHKTPDYLPAWRELAQIAFTQKNYDESLSLLGNITSRDPDNPEARILQSQAWLAKGEPDKATAVLERLDTIYPNNAIIKFQLSNAYLGAKNPGQATAALQQAIATNPNFVEAILALAEINLRAGKPQAVIPAMTDLLKKRPDLFHARFLLANAYQALGKPEEAAAQFREEIRIDPKSFQAYLLLGVILRQQGKTEEARQAFEKAAEIEPDDFNSVNQLVGMDLAEKQYDAANKRVQQVLQKRPDAAGSHFLEGRVSVAQRDWPGAETALKKTLELDPNFGPAYDLLVSVYFAANKVPQAISELDELLKKNPANPVALMTEAVAYEKMNEHEKARDAYEKLVAVKPDAAVAQNNLAYLYAERFNRLDRAYELAEKARTLDPGEGEIADTLGWILYKRGDYQQALPLLQEASGKVSDNPAVEFHLGMTNYMMGQAEAARSAFERALQTTGDFPDKSEAQRRLALLKESVGQATDLSTTELETLLKQQPNDPIVLGRLAAAYEKRGETTKAASIYEQMLKLNPKLLSANLALAQLYAGPLHKPNQALEVAKNARGLAPNDARVAGLLGQIAFQANNFSWAYSLLQESARQQKSDPNVLHNLALSAYALGKVPEARQTMQRSLDQGIGTDQSEEAKQFLSMTALAQPSADVISAEPEIRKILEKRPDYVPALMVQAAIQSRRNDERTAASTYSQILGRYPDFAPAQERLATIYAKSPDGVAKAYDLAMKARKALPDDPEVARALAEINFMRKEFRYAIQLFQESARKGPLPATDLYYLGLAQLETGEDKKGRGTLEQALAAGLGDPLAQQAKNRLSEKQPAK